MGGGVVGAGLLRPGSLLAARRGHGAPLLPLPLPPRHAPRRRFGISSGHCGGQILEEVHWGGGVSAAVRSVQCSVYVGCLHIRHSGRILSGDPGIVAYESSFLEEAGCNDFVDAICSSEKHPSLSRVRHCNSCKANVRGYDHHCPAFGNCIGQKNHRLFIALLTGFVVAESTYTMCSTKYITRCINSGTIRTENPLSLNMVIGTMLFSVLQVLWQVVFLIWHVYGICFNIKTDEWINWKKYPEFQMKEEPQSDSEIKFVNPYDKGMLCNIREFLKPK
ncbi:palmitoyltransferase Hip14 isoform X5 [Brachypodium distachyon]|uniref:palmitoyltransferase Hip14 isoform X5 n=1 Tax=Brachypodium distachyon TaxID=15368 RepID=UPI00052FDFBF|nr:palmitoyltransferase Hip14 isoform X5 [Brachypodium distachyon]|eukprot:XP_010228798.1 palmitoyltransferase Hip14 isoform X5 [Brachypodium distachyon]